MCEQGSGRWRWIWTGGILGQGTTPENLSISFFQYFVECLLVLIIYVNKVDLWPDTLLKWEYDEGYLVFILKTEWKVPCWIRREKRWEPQFFRQLGRILRRERKTITACQIKKIYVKYISLLVEENPYSASPFRCAWVEIFELFQRPQPDRRLALTSLLVSQTNHNLFNWWKYCQRRRFVNVFINLRTKNKISVLSENRGSHNVKRGTGKARAVEMKHSCHLDTAEPEHIV